MTAARRSSFPARHNRALLWISAGDVTRAIHVEPTLRPDLRQLRVRFVLPAYLQYPPQEQTIEGGRLAFLPGTTATFIGDATRNLASATLLGEKPVALDGSRFTSAPVLLELERDLTFTWRDTLGLDGPAPMTIHVTPREDQPPRRRAAWPRRRHRHAARGNRAHRSRRDR